jgi:hypothetical protein
VSRLDEWAQVVAEELGLTRPSTKDVLDLARDVAHGVERPAAPLTNLVGRDGRRRRRGPGRRRRPDQRSRRGMGA